MGTAELACASLSAIAQRPRLALRAVVTQPDRPKGRKLQLQPSPVKATALPLGVPVLQPERARDPGFVAQLASLKPDLIIVAAYGQILPRSILDLPVHGCLNVHTSLLPKYRGAAPIQWAILNGDSETGVTIMKMDEGLDTGPILATVSTAILPEDNAQTLHDRLARLGADLLLETIAPYLAGTIELRPQPAAGATYARKITKEDGRLDWTQSATVLWHRIRAFTPWPGAFTFLPNPLQPRMLKVWLAQVERSLSGPPGEILFADKNGLVIACGEGALRLLQVQLEGSKRLDSAAFLAGHPLPAGLRLS